MRLNSEIGVTYKHLRFAACLYVGLPLLVFLIGFLKWYFALIGVAALAFAFYRAVSSPNVEERHCGETMMRPTLIFWVFLFTLVWTYFGGLNSYWYQSTDWDCRNAIYYDLIKFEWPVIYDSTNAGLVYYIGHWLPPAVIGKVFLWITDSIRWGWFMGRMALWIWTSLGLTIVILLMLHFLKVSNTPKRILAIVIFVCFSGLDVLAGIYYDNLDWLLDPSLLHLEWWDPDYQFTAMTACVYWVFNQVVVPWIVTLCFLMEKDARNYVFYGVACLLCGPFPCVGIAICMIVKVLYYCVERIRNHTWTGTIKTIFSGSNIAMVLLVFPFVAAYILANNAVLAAGATDSATTAETAIKQASFFSADYWNEQLLIFLLFEVGCYLVLIFSDRKKDPIFYAIIFIFIIAPYFRVGASNDFCMRVSVPGIFILMLYVNDYLQTHFTLNLSKYLHCKWNVLGRRFCSLVLAILLLCGAVSPAVEVYRGFYHVITKGTIHLANMSIGSFDNGDVYLNFHCTNPEEQFFFKYLAK